MSLLSCLNGTTDSSTMSAHSLIDPLIHGGFFLFVMETCGTLEVHTLAIRQRRPEQAAYSHTHTVTLQLQDLDRLFHLSNFLLFKLLVERDSDTHKHTQRTLLSTSSLLRWQQWGRLGQAKARCLKLHPGLLCWWGVKFFEHLPLGR